MKFKGGIYINEIMDGQNYQTQYHSDLEPLLERGKTYISCSKDDRNFQISFTYISGFFCLTALNIFIQMT
jgi:hypothetical protein